MKHRNLLSHTKMDKEILIFADIEIPKNKFYRYKSPIFLKDTEKVLLSKRFLMVKKNYKYFIGYL